MRAPVGALVGMQVGRFLRKHRGRRGLLGDRSPTGGATGLGAAGSEIGALPWGTPRALVDREDSISIGRWAA